MKQLLKLLTAFCLAPSLFAASLADTKPLPWPLPDTAFFQKYIPPPPIAGTPMDRADLDFSLAAQATATPEEIAQAVTHVGFNVFTFSAVVRSDFTPDKYPATAAFFKRLETTANIPKNALKDLYARPRPVDGHKDLVKEKVPREEGYSYPSGHSTRAWLYALVMADLLPASKNLLVMEASKVGQSRIIGGMHYQTDVIYSRSLAELLYDVLRKEPLFAADLEALRNSEWAAK